MNVLTFDSLDSTNNYLKLHQSTLPHLTVVRARFQTAGRGQFQRQWQSNPNENLLVSFLFKDFKIPTAVQTIETLTIQAIQSLLQRYQINGQHKLPNDIIVAQQKIAGILIETKQTGQELDYVIVGVGLNVNQRSFIGLPHATSLALIKGVTFPIEEVFQQFLDSCSPFNSL